MKYRARANFHSLNFIVRNVKKIGGKPFPSHIYHSSFRCNPYVIVPVTELIDKNYINQYHTYIHLPRFQTRLKRKCIVVIEKPWYKKSKKCPKSNIFQNDKYMTMKYSCYRITFIYILGKENLVEFIHYFRGYHYRGVSDSKKALQKNQ